MLIPEFELWPECRWGVSVSSLGKCEAKAFPSAKARDAWVAQNPGQRRAVGKRNIVVKAYRQSLAKKS
jgi:hypothetical protein